MTGAGSPYTKTTVGVKETDKLTGLEQLVRMRFKLASGSADAWMRIFVLTPVWSDYHG